MELAEELGRGLEIRLLLGDIPLLKAMQQIDLLPWEQNREAEMEIS